MKKLIFVFLLVSVVFLAIPMEASALVLVPCGRVEHRSGPDEHCELKHLIFLFSRVINYLISVAALVAMYEVLSGGFGLITSVGNAEKIEKSKKRLSNGIVGFGMIVLAFVFINLLLNGLLGTPGTIRKWWDPRCAYDLTWRNSSCTLSDGSYQTPVVYNTPSEYLTPGYPTPNERRAEAPTAAPSGGTFAAPVDVTLTSATAGAEIRYTTDGSDPTSSSTLYTGSFKVSKSGAVKARAFKNGLTESLVTTATFTISAAGGGGNPPANLRLSPVTGFAGTKDAMTAAGVVTYKDNELTIVFTGQNLEGATLISGAKDISGGAGIVVRSVRVTDTAADDRVEADVTVKPTAKDGLASFTLTNIYNKSGTSNFTIQITGTQWLARQLPASKHVKFFGDWPETAPNKRMEELANDINAGLAATSGQAYKRLDIWANIYEQDFWKSVEKRICGVGRPVNGCASSGDNIIYNKENLTITGTIVHESAHKLHYWNSGNYRGVADAPKTASQFSSRWQAATGDLKTCAYLPLRDRVTWKDGSVYGSHCGFASPYGANDIFEDVAEMTKYAVIFREDLASSDEFKSDIRYKRKLNLLKEFEFIKTSPLGFFWIPDRAGNDGRGLPGLTKPPEFAILSGSTMNTRRDL